MGDLERIISSLKLELDLTKQRNHELRSEIKELKRQNKECKKIIQQFDLRLEREREEAQKLLERNLNFFNQTKDA